MFFSNMFDHRLNTSALGFPGRIAMSAAALAAIDQTQAELVAARQDIDNAAAATRSAANSANVLARGVLANAARAVGTPLEAVASGAAAEVVRIARYIEHLAGQAESDAITPSTGIAEQERRRAAQTVSFAAQAQQALMEARRQANIVLDAIHRL